MEIKHEKKKKRLYRIFITYLVRFCLQTMVLITVIFMVFSMLINMGVIQEASAVQNALEQASDNIKNTEHVSETDIPLDCSYGIYDKNGNYLYGTFGKEEESKAWEEMESGRRRAAFNEFYRYINRHSGEVCIVRYGIVAQFTNPVLKEKLPDAEYLFLGAFLVLFILQTVWIAAGFGKYLSRRLETLNNVTERIQRQDLEFERENSDIAEVDEVLGSLFDMKEALKQSLEEQWKEQNLKKEQTAALAHDIKTPLTVIRGNAELIREAEELDEAEEYNEYILKGAAQIEAYLSVLQQMLHSQEMKEGKETSIHIREFLEEIIRQARMIGQGKKLEVISKIENIPEIMKGQEENLKRAVLNVVANAEEYSPVEGRIWITARASKEGFLEITVEDQGPGFSLQDMKRGLNEFYQGDVSRHDTNHWGMGLYIANTFIRQQGGSLVLANSEEKGGARVTIFLKSINK